MLKALRKFRISFRTRLLLCGLIATIFIVTYVRTNKYFWHKVLHGNLDCFSTVEHRKNVTFIMNQFFIAMQKHNLSCWLIYGSLLGVERNGGILPWDYDGDIGFLWSDREKLETEISAELNNSNIKFTLNRIGLYSLTYAGIIVDLYAYEVSKNETEEKMIFRAFMPKDNYHKVFGCDDSYQYRYIFPLKPCKFENMTFYCPNNPDHFFNIHYCITYRLKISIPYKIDCFRLSNLKKIYQIT